MKGKEAKENQGDDCRQVFLILSFNYGHRTDADHIHTMQFTTIISVDVSKCNAIWHLQPCRPQNAMQFGDCCRAGLKMQCNLTSAAVQASKCSAIWRLRPCRPQNAMQFGDCSRAGLKMQCNLASAAVQTSKCNAIWRPQPCRRLMHDVLRRSAAKKSLMMRLLMLCSVAILLKMMHATQ